MAFDFPPAQDGLRVTNPESGVTYVYRDKYQSWIIEAVDNKQVRIHTVCCTPCDARQGDIWFDPCTNCAHVFHDGEWLPIVDCTTQGESVPYKGEKQHFHQLPDKGNELGDLWVVLDEFALYLWTTNGWLPADRYDDKELRQLIQNEEDQRKESDRAIRQDLIDEKNKRKEEDQKLWDALKDEEEARKSGDQAITDLLEDCCTKAQDGLADLTDKIEEEANAREDGDKTLQAQLDQLSSGLGETNDNLDEEIQNRIDGDEALQAELDQEKIDREAADDQLLTLVREKECKWMGEVQSTGDLPTTRYEWQPLTDFRCETVYSLTWGPDRYIAGTSNGHAWSSEDGQYWERRNVGIAFNGNVLATFYANGVWLIGGENGLVSRSVDGQVWSNFYSTTTSAIQDFAYGGGRYVYVTDGGVVAISDNGTTWTKQDHTVRWGVHGVDSILSVTYSEGLSKFVAVTARGMVLISDTGVGWDLRDPGLNGEALYTVEAVEWGGRSLLVAGGDFTKKLIYSDDSENWVQAPKNYFGDGIPTDLTVTPDALLVALSNGKTGFATDDRVESWTIESAGAKERLLAIAHAPQNSNITYTEGNWVTGGNFGQAFVRLPGNGLEPGDTWVVRDEMALFTWSTLGWVNAAGGGGGGTSGVQQLIAGDGIALTPSSGKGIVQIDVRSSGSPDLDQIKDDVEELTEAVKDVNDSITKIEDDLAEEIKAREEKDEELEDKIDAIEVGGNYFGSAPPSDPDTPAGTFFVDETTLKTYVYDGSTWVQIGGGG